MKKFYAILMAMLMCFTAMPAMTKDNVLKADAAIHLDFWNEYVDNCAVTYTSVREGAYKVVVVSGDTREMWSNDYACVPYWYSTQQLKDMIGTTPKYMGTGYVKKVNIKKSLLNDADYFFHYYY